MNKGIVRREGNHFVCEMPVSSSEWKIRYFNGDVYAVCPEHPPILLEEDKAKTIYPVLETQGNPFR